MNFDTFVKPCKSYADFSALMKTQPSKEKGDYSEEFFLRFLKWAPFLTDVVNIYNTNDPSSRHLVYQYPELKSLGVGTPNSPVVDLIIEHTDGYSLVSCKWYSSGLQLNDIAAFYGLSSKAGYPNLKNKYLATNAPSTSQVVQQVFKHSHSVIKILEDEFDLDYIAEDFNQIIKQQTSTKEDTKKWTWRNKREQLSFIKFARNILQNFKAKVQLPPGWGKTYLMWRLDKMFWKRFGGQTICMADGVIVLKQNFDLYMKQYRACGIERPSLVICSGANDASMVDWPVEVSKNDPVKIARWLQKNPHGMVFCYYGNTKSLEEAVQLNKIKNKHRDFTFAACDEASRTCSPIGTGWSHIVHDSLIPIKYRAFLDATHRHHRAVGMDVKKLYGEMADHVSQVESEKCGSTTGFFIQGLVFDSAVLQQNFHQRNFIKGKKYTVDEKCSAVALLEEFINDTTMEHNLTFGHTIKNLNNFAQALEDSRQELMAKYKSVKYKKLANIKIYVADTHIKTSRDIRDDLEEIYKQETSSIVLTSRLLYRGWSQIKLDSILFLDNSHSISYTVQALGRGLRKNGNRPAKLCKVLVPVDLDNSSAWDHMLRLLNNIKEAGDSRPVENILGLVKNPRGKAQRKIQSGNVVLPVNGYHISAVDIRKNLKTAIVEGTNWFEWNVWFDLARDMFMKAESNKHFIPSTGGRNYAAKIVYDELILNDRYKTIIDSEYKENGVTKEEKYRWLWRKVVKLGFKKIKFSDEYKVFKMDILDTIENNDSEKRQIVKTLFDDLIKIRKDFWFVTLAASRGYERKAYDSAMNKLAKKAESMLGKFYLDRDWNRWIGSIAHGTDLIDKTYSQVAIAECEEYIKNKRIEYVTSAIDWAINLHETKFIPMTKIRKHVVKQFPHLSHGTRYEVWVHGGDYAGTAHAAYLEKLNKPTLKPGQPICSCCNTLGGEMLTKYENYRKPNQKKVNFFSDLCLLCKKEYKKKEKA